jgi:hypothetical protein
MFSLLTSIKSDLWAQWQAKEKPCKSYLLMICKLSYTFTFKYGSGHLKNTEVNGMTENLGVVSYCVDTDINEFENRMRYD